MADRLDIETVPSWFPVGFSLLTHGQRQYVAYYDAQHQMTVAVRTLDQHRWEFTKLDSKVGWDSHNGVTLAVDGNGDLHLSGNMHGVPLVYFRTDTPGDITTLRRLPMAGKDEKRCTYPHFLHDAKGRLVFHYRDGGSGNGRRFYNVYDLKSRTWARLFDTPLFVGQGKRNAYPGGPVVGPDKRFHVFWVWRDTPDCATNNNLSYARSPDLVHWETAAGKPVALPMTLGTEGLIVDPIPSGGGIINGGARLVFDSQSRPMIAYHKSDAQENMQLYVARFAEGEWTRRVITAWDKPVKFSGRGAMPFIGIRISSPQPVEEGVWAVGYHHRDYGRGTVAFKEATLRPVTSKFTPPPRELPVELARPEIKFDGIGVRQADDLGRSGNPNVRYLLIWDVLPSNHDRKRSGPLPPASILRVCKLVRTAAPDGQ
ncbi:MAG: BNR repeat-containing protein [Pirellulales bacterium]|nr:BNR repeat-containing protein [Pirellulales bacterium]